MYSSSATTPIQYGWRKYILDTNLLQQSGIWIWIFFNKTRSLIIKNWKAGIYLLNLLHCNFITLNAIIKSYLLYKLTCNNWLSKHVYVLKSRKSLRQKTAPPSRHQHYIILTNKAKFDKAQLNINSRVWSVL